MLVTKDAIAMPSVGCGAGRTAGRTRTAARRRRRRLLVPGGAVLRVRRTAGAPYWGCGARTGVRRTAGLRRPVLRCAVLRLRSPYGGCRRLLAVGRRAGGAYRAGAVRRHGRTGGATRGRRDRRRDGPARRTGRRTGLVPAGRHGLVPAGRDRGRRGRVGDGVGVGNRSRPPGLVAHARNLAHRAPATTASFHRHHPAISSTTGTWSDGALPLRSLRSMVAPVTRAASAGVAYVRSMRMPSFRGNRSCW